MTAKVKIHRYLLGGSAGPPAIVETGGHTVAECLRQATTKFPKLKNELFDASGKLPGHMLVLLNSEEVQNEELGLKVKEDDTIEVLPIIGGG
jgi:sulfur carrier protein ThiS